MQLRPALEVVASERKLHLIGVEVRAREFDRLKESAVHAKTRKHVGCVDEARTATRACYSL